MYVGQGRNQRELKREVRSGQQSWQELPAGQLINCFATRHFRCQDVALGSEGGRGSVGGWHLQVPVAT